MRCHRNSGRGASSHGDSTDGFGPGGIARMGMKSTRREIHRRLASITADATLSGGLLDTPIRLTGRGDRRGSRWRQAGHARLRPRRAVGGRVEHGGDLHQGRRGRCLDRAALARAPGRGSDVGLARMASRSARACGLDAPGLGGMVGRDCRPSPAAPWCSRRSPGTWVARPHLVLTARPSAPGFRNGGKFERTIWRHGAGPCGHAAAEGWICT